MRLKRLNTLATLFLGCCAGCISNGRGPDRSQAGPRGVAPVFAVADAAPRPAGPVTGPATLPATGEFILPEFQTVADAFDGRGTARGVVYTVTVPRDDLTPLIEGVIVPTEAGLESTIHFYAGCCGGRLGVVGQFCLLDFEVNDVIDALRKERIDVASVGPMLLHTRDRVMLVRVQGEGQPEPLARALREALRFTGRDRAAPLAPGTLGPRPK